MAHFPPSFLDEVLARTDIVELISRHVELKKSGSNLMGLCPFHHEKSPSFSVSPDKQLYYCFGCGKGGGAFQFLMEHDSYSFPEAVEYLAEKAGLEVPRQAGRAGDEARHAQALEMLARVADIFARKLASDDGKGAREYLKKRGMPEQIIRHYKLGFAPAGYGFMQQCFGDEARTLAQLEYIGLLFKNDRGGYGDRFRGRLMFPIKDRRGKVVGFGGRILGEGEPKYLNSPETPYFRKSELLYGLSEHREHIRKRKQLIVVEGYMDVLALAAHGLPLALAPLGTAIGERQIQQILRLQDAPVFCFDGDRAGRQASWRALERMMPVLAAEHSPRFLYLPEGEDPDSLLAKEGGEAFAARLESEAKPVLETWLSGLKLMAGKGAEGRARMAKKADAMLAQMQDEYLRQAWRQEAEQATGIHLQQQNRPRRASVVHALSSGLNAIEEKFLVGLIQKPSRLKQLPAEAREFFLDDEGVNRIYTRALSMMADAKEDQDTHIARQLMREFPDDPRIPRWVNQETVQDREFESLLLDMQSNYIRRCQKRGGYSLEESVQFQLRLEELKKKQIEMKEALDNTGAQ